MLIKQQWMAYFMQQAMIHSLPPPRLMMLMRDPRYKCPQTSCWITDKITPALDKWTNSIGQERIRLQVQRRNPVDTHKNDYGQITCSSNFPGRGRGRAPNRGGYRGARGNRGRGNNNNNYPQRGRGRGQYRGQSRGGRGQRGKRGRE